MKKKVMLES